MSEDEETRAPWDALPPEKRRQRALEGFGNVLQRAAGSNDVPFVELGSLDLLQGAFANLRHYLEDEAWPDVTWAAPVVSLEYDVPWGSLPEDGHAVFTDGDEPSAADLETRAAAGEWGGRAYASLSRRVLLHELTHRVFYEDNGEGLLPYVPRADVDAAPEDVAARFAPWAMGGEADDVWWRDFLAEHSLTQPPASPPQDADLPSLTIRVTLTPEAGEPTECRIRPVFALWPAVVQRATQRAFYPVTVALVTEGAPPLTKWPDDARDALWRELEDAFDELARPYLERFTAGLPDLTTPPAEQAVALDRVQRLPYSTAPWAGGLTTGYVNAADGRYEVVTLEHGAGLVTAESARGQLRFAPAPKAADLASTFPGIDAGDAHELAATLKRDGRLKGALIAQAAVQFTVKHPSELVVWDDRFRQTFGWKRPGSRAGQSREQVLRESRRDFDRLLYARLRLGANAEHVGRAFSHGEDTYGERELYRLGYRERDAEGLPLRVRFDPVGVSVDILNNPGRSESLGYVQSILALPESTPGRWATALIAFLSEQWRRKVNEPGAGLKVTREDGKGPGLSFGTVTRAYVFKCVPPDPPQTPAELLDSDAATGHARRAPAYFAAAVDLLIDAKLIDACIATPTRYAEKHGREPWPGTNADGTKRRAARGVDWGKAWLTQPLEIRPGGALLGELLEQRQKRTRGLKRGAG